MILGISKCKIQKSDITNEVEKIVNVEKIQYVKEYPEPKVQVVQAVKEKVAIQNNK